ncbi:hypothetical protein Taro_027182 [Colocasia esculenta]|uniref:Uncharacterized protein n=1 Tax=Colocasia esculenta TaxID=4460 RepID=A0A843VDA3_COLES|nr:hypothetical protein [Colocasia esculenta]
MISLVSSRLFLKDPFTLSGLVNWATSGIRASLFDKEKGSNDLKSKDPWQPKVTLKVSLSTDPLSSMVKTILTERPE